MATAHAVTRYDRVAYPTAVHESTHPERLAVLARLAGLDPVPPGQARVLEIGGGTCLGLIAFAAAWPDSRCVGFDIATSAIAEGRRLAGEAVPNVSLEVLDILQAKSRYAAGSFDYAIAHGVYAWVPPKVQRALLELMAHVLSARGLGFVSYNAMPGGHIRLLLREMLLHALQGIEGTQERIDAAYSFLLEYAHSAVEDETGHPVDSPDPLHLALRRQAASMASRPASVLFHDELGDCYEPKSLTEVVRAAEAAGLRFLTDAGRNRWFDGFLTLDSLEASDPDAQVLRAAQMRDHVKTCFFRSTVLAPAAAGIDRRLDAQRTSSLWVSSRAQHLGAGEFAAGEDRFTLVDPALVTALSDLATRWPARVRVNEVAVDPAQRNQLLDLARHGYVHLHHGDAPFVLDPGERPETGAWIRRRLGAGDEQIVTLDHRPLRIDQPELRALLVAADGTRTLAELSSWGHGVPADQVRAALAAAGRQALLRG
jgi:hypothetical protein